MYEDLNQELKKIEKEMDEIREDTSKGGKIAMVAISGASLLVGFILLFYGIIIVFWEPRVSVPFFIIGGVLLIFGVIALPTNLARLREAVRVSSRYNALEDKRDIILERIKAGDLVNEDKAEKKESDEDTLLRLLSEGKISIDEYKILSKK